MALQKTFENQESGTSNGYYRVREVGTYYEKDKDEPMSLEGTFIVEAYDYDTGDPLTYSHISGRAPWNPEGIGAYSLTLPDMEPVQNLIIKAYEHLKTLPEFNGATDC